MLKTVLISAALVLSFTQANAQAVTPEENERMTREIAHKLEAGKVPVFTERFTAYTGSCWITNSSFGLNTTSFALVGLKGTPTGPVATWWITYGVPGRPNSFRDVTQESYNSQPQRPKPGSIFENRKLVVPISQSPLLFGQFSEDREIPGRLYGFGIHLGYFYCKLDPVPQGTPTP
jgi:hypothetical protein